ncbi:MAG: AsmA family protein, partial [Bryocella sp.]
MSSPEPEISIDPIRKRRRRRKLLLAGLLVVLFIAALLGPPLINGERYRRRITTSMSEALGRPVHIDRISFHLLPMPGITLGGLVVDENPAFGNEPVIRANVVVAQLRLTSLWRHRFEVSEVKFETDENGAGASLNIVRNAEGRWNLQDILMQAAHVNAAPTAQTHAGSAPRFPYIEAVGARVNLKLGDRKMPFSLTNADFALWLPSPEQWHVRLKANPARTDLNASDTGIVTLEGTLGRAPSLAQVPIDLSLNWAHVPMGQASRVLTGEDQQWR